MGMATSHLEKSDQKETSGSKYRKTIVPCHGPGHSIIVDVYSVLWAFDVTDPAVAHAVKKLLMPGQRGSKTYVQDLEEARDALDRAIDYAERADKQ